MAIQNRRGAYSDFDKSKLVEGEWAVVQSGDPNSGDGQSVYMCFTPGTVKRMATYEDMVDSVEAAIEEGIDEQVAEAINTQAGEYIQDCQTATQNANTATQTATTAASSASSAASSANTAAGSANTAASDANAAATAAQAVVNNISNANVYFQYDPVRTNIVSGVPLANSLGRIGKWFFDLEGKAAWSNIANNLTTTAAGSVLDARQGKILADMISGGTAILEKVYPVGCIYQSTVATNPGDSTVLGFGTWTDISDKVLMAHDTATTSEEDGYFVLKTNENITSNIQRVYIWTRTA